MLSLSTSVSDPVSVLNILHVYNNFLASDDEIEQIKSTYRLPLNTVGEPAHIPSHYDVRIDMGGLREEDKNEEGYFEYSGHSNINFNWNTESKFVVLHAGATPGYEIVSLELSTGSFSEDGSILKTSMEHYKEKEMLILHVEEENFLGEIGNQYNLRIQFKNWLAKANTGLYESSYLDEVCFSGFLDDSIAMLKIQLNSEFFHEDIQVND